MIFDIQSVSFLYGSNLNGIDSVFFKCRFNRVISCLDNNRSIFGKEHFNAIFFTQVGKV